MNAHDLVELVLDTGSFVSWDVPPRPVADPAYAATLDRAAERAGTDEAVVTGEGTVRGRRVAVVVGEFAFLAGSIGVATAERVERAFREATRRRLPVLAAPVSGGTRMQEGTRAFVQMVTVSAAVLAHREAGLPYLTFLRHPTTGGVFASWGSMGHVTVAEPGALIGFLGPRVYEALQGREFPAGVQTAENLYRHGLVDAVVDSRHLRSLVDQVLAIVSARPHGPSTPASRRATARPPGDVDDWAVVERSRRPGRPGLRDVLAAVAVRAVPLSGSGRGESDPSLTLTLAQLGDYGVVVLGQDRLAQTADAPLGPAALRVAARGIRLAEELRLPIVTVVDTPGAALSREAEEGGLAAEIGRSLAALVRARVPVVSVLLGEGAGGGAMALLPADHVIALEDAWLSPLPPEGASALVYRTTTEAPRVAREQRIAAWHLFEDGIVDEVVVSGGVDDADVAERSGSADDRVVRALGTALNRSLGELGSTPLDTLIALRGRRFAPVPVVESVGFVRTRA